MMNSLAEGVSGTYTQLEEWGRWVRAGGVLPQCKSSAAVLMNAMVQQSTVGINISDDAALRVDSKVALLKRKDKQMGQVLVWYFVNADDIRGLAKRMDMGKDKAQRLLHSSIAWIDASLEAANDP